MRGLVRRVRELRPDLAICAQPGPLDLLMAAALRRLHVPFVVVVHDDVPTWIVTLSPMGTNASKFEAIFTVNNTKPSLPTAAFDALSETVVWLASFVMISDCGDDVEPLWLESPE